MRLHDYLEYYAKVQPDVTFAEFGAGKDKLSLNYREANQRANQLANAFVSQNLERGDRIAYLSKNSIDMVLMYYAAAKAGVVPVPLNYRLAPREWLYIINDSEAKLLMCDVEYSEGIQGIHNELTHTHQFVSMGESDNVPENWIQHESLISKQDSENLNLDIDENDQLYQMYTSGTTGLPKGAMISHRAIDNNLGMLSRILNIHQSQERMLVVMPLYHAGAAVIGMASIAAGSTLVLHRDFDPIATIDSLINDEITVGGMVPSMVQACLLGVPDIQNKKFPLLKMMAYGASPIAEETLRSAMDVFGCDFVQIFGMTETSAAATSLSPDDHRKALDGRPELLLSAGRPVLGTEVRIVDETGEEVARNTVGEVAVRGPQVMMGYWHLDEATAKSIRNGWMHTGDAAIMDEDGYIFIQDRIKDMIVSGGENIYPREIENALFEHPNLADAAAIGIPSEKWGEEILVFVVIKPGEEITEAEMIDFCRERLAGYKIPRKFEFIEELPRNATGKVLKKDLREPYWEGIDRRVG